jgi:hypothetical protein
MPCPILLLFMHFFTTTSRCLCTICVHGWGPSTERTRQTEPTAPVAVSRLQPAYRRDLAFSRRTCLDAGRGTDPAASEDAAAGLDASAAADANTDANNTAGIDAVCSSDVGGTGGGSSTLSPAFSEHLAPPWYDAANATMGAAPVAVLFRSLLLPFLRPAGRS